MIIQQTNRNIIKSTYHNNNTSEFTIDEKSKPFFMQLMRSGIYTNKEAAVVREYTTNAIDEHVTHNVNKPVEIHVPTFAEPFIYVRDFGAGLTDKEIRQIYISYGNSTKRNSNDVTGCMGIGCKAAFALDSKQFSITSIVKENGKNVQRNYTAYLDEDELGKIDLVNETTTYNETGIKIQVAVSHSSIRAFENEISKIYRSSKPGSVKILNVENEWITKPLKKLNNNDKLGYVIYNVDNNDRVFHKGPFINMGNIYYPIDQSTILSKSSNNSQFEALFDMKGLVITVPIGSVNMAASREGLQYDKQTMSALTQTLRNVTHDLVKESAAKLNNTTCVIERLKLSLDMFKSMSSALHNNVLQLIKPEYQNLINYNSYYLHLEGVNEDYTCHLYKVKEYGTAKLQKESERARIDNITNYLTHIIFYDVNTAVNKIAKNSVVRRIKNFMAYKSGDNNYLNSGDSVYLIEYDSAKVSKQKILEQTKLIHNKTKTMYDIEDIAPLAVELNQDNKGTTTHVDLFKYNRERHWGVSDNWVESPKVSISASNNVLYLNLSGYYGLKSDQRNAAPGSAELAFAQLDKEKIDAMCDFMSKQWEHIPSYAHNALTHGLSSKLSETKIVNGTDVKRYKNTEEVFYNNPNSVPIFGSRKKHWKLLDDNPNAINLYDVFKETVKNHAQYNKEMLSYYYCIKQQLQEKHKIATHNYEEYKVCLEQTEINPAKDYYAAGYTPLTRINRTLRTNIPSQFLKHIPNKSDEINIVDVISHTIPNSLRKTWHNFVDIVHIANNNYLNQERLKLYIKQLESTKQTKLLNKKAIKKDHVLNTCSKIIKRAPLLTNLGDLLPSQYLGHLNQIEILKDNIDCRDNKAVTAAKFKRNQEIINNLLNVIKAIFK